MDPIDRLTEYFTKFPGIGIRQARRFVYYLLTRDAGTRKNIARLIQEIGDHVHQCSLCGRFSTDQKEVDGLCTICLHPERQETLLVVEKDADLERIERSHAYHGRYFVLGGIVPIGSDNPSEFIRVAQLTNHLERAPKGLKEVIFGLSVTPDGEHTGELVIEAIRPQAAAHKIAITHLGRGLSTGSELEYADRATLENAFQGRK